MIIREARESELSELQSMLLHEGYGYIDLRRCICFVAEDAGRIVGMLPARLVWEVDPALVNAETRIGASKAFHSLQEALEAWVREPSRNATGVRILYTHTEADDIASWAERKGWRRIYTTAHHLLKIV